MAQRGSTLGTDLVAHDFSLQIMMMILVNGDDNDYVYDEFCISDICNLNMRLDFKLLDYL